jgi:CHAD domain-containing protein
VKRKVTIHWEAHQSPPHNARKHLAPLVRDWFAAGRKATEAGRTPHELHQFRLATKRLRYTLELFRGVYGRGLTWRLNALSQAQDMLGTSNDYHVTALGLEQRVLRDPALQPVYEQLERRASEKRGEFVHHWRRTFSPREVEARWVTYFRRNAGGRRTHAARRPPIGTQ